jgi:hypothetical protein
MIDKRIEFKLGGNLRDSLVTLGARYIPPKLTTQRVIG